MADEKGYWVETIDGNQVFLNGANRWEVLLDGKIVQFQKNSADEHIVCTYVLRNVVQWWYGEKR
jgi:hypothetical protein